MSGKPRGDAPKVHVSSQRYTETERNLIQSVAGPGRDFSQFIHDAAVDRARQFSEAIEEVGRG